MCLGFLVSSVEGVPGESFGEVARRSRQAQLAVGIVYLGIPLLFLGLILWISAEADSATYNWQAGLLPLGVLVAGWFFRKRSRHKPSRWAGAGMMTGGVTGLFTVFYTIVLDGPGVLFLPGAVVGAIIGSGFGKYGQRVLLHPAVPELAETPYELSFRMRGLTRLRLVIDDSSVSLRESVRVRTAEGDGTSERSKTYPFSAITGLHDVTLSGVERLKYPITLQLAPASTPGPAIILQAQGADWVLPHDDAAVITQIINRRKAARA
jgi:hypothetical protein